MVYTRGCRGGYSRGYSIDGVVGSLVDDYFGGGVLRGVGYFDVFRALAKVV